MRDNNPFNILKPAELSLGYIKNFIEIKARARFYSAGGNLEDVIEFVYDDKARAFIPVSRSVVWDQIVEVDIVLTLEYEILVPFRGKGSGFYWISQKWRVKYGDKGIVLEAAASHEDHGSSGEGDFAVAVDLKPDQPTAETMLTQTTLLLKLVGGFTDQGIGVGVGPVQVGMGGDAGVYSKTYKFNLGLLATGKPKPAIQLPEDLLKHTVWFDSENQPQLNAGELRRLEDKWVDPLLSRAPDLAATIKDGSCPLYLDGYASVTGRSDKYNLELSVDRIFSVENALKSLFSSKDIKFVPNGHGRANAAQKGPSPQEKRVEILIARHWAERAIEAARN